MDVRSIIGRKNDLFAEDMARNDSALRDAIGGARVLVLGGAGSIGKEVCFQLFQRGPAALHVIDISENNLVELVRNLRSSQGYIAGETRFLPLDMGAVEARAFLDSEKPYDYVLNLAALKHVRSEKDAFSLMRMIKVNILDTRDTLARARAGGAKKYFAVSTDKAKNPANLMGATKRIMEDVLFCEDTATPVTTARFANVAFSDGSLLHGFRQRLALGQPIAAPRDVRRYFMTGPESGVLCLSALVLGKGREIFFPKLDADTLLITFSEVATRFLAAHGYEAVAVASETEARARVEELRGRSQWPCFFSDSDTAGEKPFEEFYSGDDAVDFDRFADMGVIETWPTAADAVRRDAFLADIAALRGSGHWDKPALVNAIRVACPELSHIVAERFLDDKM